MSADGRSKWHDVKDKMNVPGVRLGRHLSYWMQSSPRRMLHSMSYYKFSAKMIGGDKRVLDIGCSEGLGTWLIAKECGYAEGIDFDQSAIDVARSNWNDPSIDFACEDFLERPRGSWDAVVSFDVIEHVHPERAGKFLEAIAANLTPNGVTVIGTPSEASQQYASEISKAGHVNIYSADRLQQELSKYFRFVMMFAANDEVVHTGYFPLAHYYLALACQPR